jgi:hypothetical protein
MWSGWYAWRQNTSPEVQLLKWRIWDEWARQSVKMKRNKNSRWAKYSNMKPDVLNMLTG